MWVPTSRWCVLTDILAAFGKQTPYTPGPIDPIELFRSLKLRPSGGIKELWAPQADALKAWHERRGAKDTLFQLSTGAGKTLIGLVSAQSLVNESRGLVAYSCATRQLVEQTRDKALELGMRVATYHGSTWTDEDLFRSGKGPLITTHAALLHGTSRFRHDTFAGVVFDDAHTAHDAVRNVFTLSISRGKYPELYSVLVDALAEYFRRVGREYVFNTIVSGRDPSSVLMVPMFEAWRLAHDFQSHIESLGLSGDSALRFAWGHLGARLDRCVILFDYQTVQFTPLLPAVNTQRLFQGDTRRLYLSATLPVADEFVRTFGRTPELTITPGGRAGEGQRLILLPPSGDSDKEARDWAEALTRGTKTVVMVPSYAAARVWDGAADVFETDEGHERIRRFASSTDERLVLVARYDGIDLPDNACRVMVVDGLPSGLALIDRFFEQHLERRGITSAKVASRFVQLLGRTSRGMADFGVVALVGRRLINWVLPPANRALLPLLIQKQIALAERLTELEGVDGQTLMRECLGQTHAWTRIYDDGMDDAKPSLPASDASDSNAVALAVSERAAADALWDGDYKAAIKHLHLAKEIAFATDRNTGAWFLHWTGFALQALGATQEAVEKYRAASRVRRDLGPPENEAIATAEEASRASVQAKTMAQLIRDRGRDRVLRELAEAARCIVDPGATTGQQEEAVRILGEYFAFTSTRPEKETAGKGPDGLWARPDNGLVIFFDAKIQKESKHYNKDTIGLSAQHALWVAAEYPDATRRHFIIGPRVPATAQATVPPGLRVVEAPEVARLCSTLSGVYQAAFDRNLPLFLPADLQIGIEQAGLTWDEVADSLEAIDLEMIEAPN